MLLLKRPLSLHDEDTLRTLPGHILIFRTKKEMILHRFVNTVATEYLTQESEIHIAQQLAPLPYIIYPGCCGTMVFVSTSQEIIVGSERTIYMTNCLFIYFTRA